MRASRNGKNGKGNGGNVFADLGFPDADDLQMKAELTRQIGKRIRILGLTRVQAAKRLGLKQADVQRLMNGRPTEFSAQRLMSLLTALGMEVEISLRPRSRRSNAAAGIRLLEEVS